MKAVHFVLSVMLILTDRIVLCLEYNLIYVPREAM